MASSEIKTNWEVDQTPGKSVQINYSHCALVTSGGGYSNAFIPFGFFTRNTNYDVTFESTTVGISNVGNATVSVDKKRNNGVVLKFAGVNAAAQILWDSHTVMTITFA